MAQNNVSRSKFVTALRTLYRYDKDTGNLIDKVTGEALGTPNATGTLRCCFLGEATTVSRLVWMYHFGKAPTGRVWSILNKKGLRTQTTNGHLANCTKIEYLYDSGSRRSGRDAPNPDQPRTDKVSGETGITWQASHKSWKVVVRGKYVGSAKTLDEAKSKRDSYIMAQNLGRGEWLKSAADISPSKVKEVLHTDTYEYRGKEYRQHGRWNKFVFNDFEHKDEDVVKAWIDAIVDGDPLKQIEIITKIQDGEL